MESSNREEKEMTGGIKLMIACLLKAV